MKTFLVYDLDTGLPVAVGEAIKSEWERSANSYEGTHANKNEVRCIVCVSFT